MALVLGWGAATWLTSNCAGADQEVPGGSQQRRRPRAPAELPPMPADAPLPIKWEAGPWWQGQHSVHATISITNAGIRGIVLDATAASRPEYLTLQSLELGAPASEPLTLGLVKLGTDHPLHVLGACTVRANAAIRVDNAAMSVDGPAIVGGRLAVGHGSVTANSGLLVGEGPDATAAVNVAGGTLTVTNPSHSARFILGASGKSGFLLNSGIVRADFLEVTDTPGNRFVFKDGLLKVRGISVANHLPLTIGDGVHPATLELCGGTNLFSGPLIISSNATLLGNGTICGPVVNYGTILARSAGDALAFASAGPCVSSLTNWGRMYMTNGGKLSFEGTVSNHAAFPITVVNQTGAVFAVQFTSVGGLSHALQYKTALDDANWKTVDSTTGTGETLSLADRAPAGQPRYYRIYVGR